MGLRVRTAIVTAAVAVTALTLAACGSSSAKSGSSGGPTGKYASELKSLETVLPAAYGGPTTPVKVTPGIKIAAISSSQQLQGDVDAAAGLAKAAKSIGWTERTFDGQGSTTTQSEQIADAVSWGAKVIDLIAVNPVQVQEGLKIAKRAGVLIVACDGATGDFSPNPVKPGPPGDVWPTVEVSPKATQIGTQMGRWIVADSNGTANTLVLADKEFTGAIIGPEYAVKVLDTCSGCTTSKIVNFTGDQIASSLGPEVVSYLRTHTKVDYILVPYDPAVQSIITALQGAGLASKIKIISNLGNQANLTNIRNGVVQAADYAWDAQYIGYATIDQTLRVLAHVPVFEPNDERIPTVVLTKNNLGSVSGAWQAPFNYEQKFLSLWKR